MSNKQIVCECGHKNPEGTQLCLNCGRLINDDYDKKDNRRYALRWASDTFENKNRTILDRIWNFFASIKTGVTLLVLTVIAASIGTIFPQEYFIPMNVNQNNIIMNIMVLSVYYIINLDSTIYIVHGGS